MLSSSRLDALQYSIGKLKEQVDTIEMDTSTRQVLSDCINGISNELVADEEDYEVMSEEEISIQFSDFNYCPEIVLALNRENKVVYQNRPILGKVDLTGQKAQDIIRFFNKPGIINDISKAWNNSEAVKSRIINPLNLKAFDVVYKRYNNAPEPFMLIFPEDISLNFLTNKKSHFNNNKDDQNNELINKYKLVANSISDIFFILDKNLKFNFIAPSVERVLQYSYKELLGNGFDMLIPEWSGNTLKKNLDTVLALHPDISEPQRFTIQLSSKYGRLNWYEVQITGIYDRKNVLQGFNGVCRDITERLKYEEALRLAKKKAEESDRLKSAFLANMSHEIRTPLNGIIGFSTMLANKHVLNEKKVKYADYIVSNSKQLLTLISDIIDISKIEAGQLTIFKTEVDVKHILGELHETLALEQERLQKEEVQVEQIVPEEDDLILNTDEVRLKQLLSNLLLNALKFTNEGKIQYGCEFIAEDKLKFFVKDSGPGIPRNLKKAVFERFRQGELDLKNKAAGTGLGLAISKGLVELMGGTIGVKSQVGIGSEFYFVLPY
jgi:PAS domain S-box-containing protein